MYLNRVYLLGNLTQDPELKNLPSGSSVTNFGIATNRTWTDQNGAKQESVEYHNIVAFGKPAEIISQYLQKGSLVLVEGRLQTRSWEAQDGQKRYKTEVIVENFQMGPRNANTGSSQPSQAKSSQQNSSKNSSNTKSSHNSLPTVDMDEDEIDLEEIPF